MITASHNPGEYNGMKLISQFKEIDKEYEKRISERCTQNPNLADWDKVGKTTEDNEIIKNHIDLVIEQVDSAAIMRAKPKVIVDCNGAGAVITPMLMRDLGCEVTVMNDSLEGFARPSEPNEKNLQGLIERMRSEKADFGLAHDGDADRVVVVDDTGSVLPLDVPGKLSQQWRLPLLCARSSGRMKAIS
jgi:phosphomannomutase